MLTPFEVEFDDGVIAEIQARLRAATLPQRRGEGWEHGTSIDYLDEFRRYWVETFDWAAARERLNAHPQFTVTIDGLTVHFYWVRGSGPSPRPLLLTHGWPGSVVEFVDVIDKLARPERSGGDVADSFDVVVPSLPGFGFSGRPAGVLGPQSTARLWRRLMTEVLGYQRFGAQGGDLGSMVTAYLGGEHADVVSAIHLNFVTDPAGSGQRAHARGACLEDGLRRVPRARARLLRLAGTQAADLGGRAAGQSARGCGVDARAPQRLE